MVIPPKIAFGLTGSKPVVLTITPRDSELELVVRIGLTMYFYGRLQIYCLTIRLTPAFGGNCRARSYNFHGVNVIL